MRRSFSLLVISVLVTLCFIITATPAVQAQSSPELTLDQAISMALDNNNSLKKADLEIDKGYENRQSASDKVTYIPAGGGSNPGTEIAWYSLLSSDLTWQMNKKLKSQKEDTLVLSVCQQYWQVQTALENVNSAQKAREQAEMENRQTQSGFRVGVKSLSEVTLAQEKLKKALAALEQAKKSLEEEYISFNHLVGLKPDDRPELTETLEFVPLEVSSIEHEVGRVLAESPTTWLAEQMVNQQVYLSEMAFATGTYRPYQVRKIEKEQAEIDAVEAKELTRQLVYTLHAKELEVEEMYRQAQTQVNTAQEVLRLAKLRYDIGLATKLDVLTAETALAQAKAGAQSILQQQAYLKLAFQKPWALAAQESSADLSASGAQMGM